MDDPVGALLRDLVGAEDEVRLRQAQRLLSSRAAPPPTIAATSDAELLDGLLKRLLRARRYEAATRVSYLATNFILTESSGLQRPWSALYMLGALNNAGSATSLPPPADPPPSQDGQPARGADPAQCKPILAGLMQGEDGKEQPRPASEDRFQPRTESEDGPPGSTVQLQALIRDLLFAAQGIDGTLIRFDQETMQYELLPASTEYDASTNEMVLSVCELGYLFRLLSDAIPTLRNKQTGFISKALAAALEAELDGYYKNLVALEGEIDHSASTSPGGPSLRKVFVWAIQLKHTMRCLTQIANSCIGNHGAQLLSRVFTYTKHGDPKVSQLARRIFSKTCMPFGEMLLKWLRDGDLSDQYGEFFVVENHVEGPFSLRLGMLPSFLPRVLADTVLTAGQTVHFLRTQCCDAKWLLQRKASKLLPDGASHLDFDPTHGSASSVQRVSRAASQTASQRLKYVLFTEFRFLDHCANIKRFLLLGQGDFFQGLLEQLGPELDKPFGSILRSTLIHIFETEYWNCVTGEESKDQRTLEHLDIRLFQGSIGDCGWDVFSLDYQITNTPLGIIFTKEVMQTYLSVFNFLWRLRRADYALGTVWRRQQHRSRANRQPKDSRTHQLLYRGHHLVRSLYNYVVWGVLEESWCQFIDNAQNATSLADLSSAHGNYLGQVRERVFLSDETRPLHKRWGKLMEILMEFAARTQRQDCEVSDLETKFCSELNNQKRTVVDRGLPATLQSLVCSL